MSIYIQLCSPKGTKKEDKKAKKFKWQIRTRKVLNVH